MAGSPEIVDHFALLSLGVKAWNEWRIANPGVTPDLRCANLNKAHLERANLGRAHLEWANLFWAHLEQANLERANLLWAHLEQANLNEAHLEGANLFWAHLEEANLEGAHLEGAHLEGAHLEGAYLKGAHLEEANLEGAHLNEANFKGANLNNTNLKGAFFYKADLSQANLTGANLIKANLALANLSGAHLGEAKLNGTELTGATLIQCDLEGADLTGCQVYGTSVWDARLTGAIQRDLIITPDDQSEITVDNLEVAQFVYLLLNNAKIREVIDTITSKAVLILGRFTPERKRTLDALRDALRARDYLPIVFDFEKPKNRDYTETVSTLAHLSRFVIADLTDPQSVPQELTAIIPRLLSVPIRPLLLGDQRAWAMFEDLKRYPQVIAPLYYSSDAMLLGCLESDVIATTERKVLEMRDGSK